MMKIVACVLAGLLAGLAVAWWQGLGPVADGSGPGASGVADRLAIEQRISELETELRLERLERQLLADRIEALQQATPAGTAAGSATADPLDAAIAVRGRAGDEATADGSAPDTAEFERLLRGRRLERFVQVGFTPERAQALLQREDELEMEVLLARYEARQNGASDAEVANMTVSRALREELSDAEYELFLAGQGRPTAVMVTEVLTNSPARSVGIRPGDRILGYNGKRVFEMGELSQLTETAKPGSMVLVDVDRDGQRLQFYIEAGPLGVGGGGTSTRRDFGGSR